MQKLITLLFCLLVLTSIVTAQKHQTEGLIAYGSPKIHLSARQLQVNGKVTDKEGVPLPGVNIVIDGTMNGTVTDLDGKYTITIPESNSTLVFSFVGYLTQNIAVNGNSYIEVKLEEGFQRVDEVVVIGYGVQKKSHLTGSVSKVKSEKLEQVPTSNIENLLQGKIAGVQIQNTTSEVGVTPQIRVRGMGSINAGNEPLIVIDGYPVSGGLNSVNIADIESIEVLKDASSAAIYGSRGANGVIIITTKTGNVDKPQYTFNSYMGVKYPYEMYDIMPSSEYSKLKLQERLLGNPDATFTDIEDAMLIVGDNADWQEEAFRKAMISNTQFSFSGGKNEVKYYVSTSYMKDEGLMKRNDYQKFNLRAKLDAKLSKRAKLSINITPTYSYRERPANNYIDYMRFLSFLPVRHTAFTSELTGQPEGDWAHPRHFSSVDFNALGYTKSNGEPFGGSVNLWSSSNNNPVSIRERNERLQKSYRLLSNATFSLDLMKNLTFKTNVGFYTSYGMNESFTATGASREGEANRASFTSSLESNYLMENTLNYSLKSKAHSLDALAGFTSEKTWWTRSSITGTNFPTDYIHTITGATIIELPSTYTTKEAISLSSLLFRVNYAYNDKYLISTAFRTDGSSLFGPDNKWGNFPSASIGWKISDEPFFKNNLKNVNFLKFRMSYGVTGNNNIPNYAHVDLLDMLNYPLGANNGAVTAGIGLKTNTLANKAISWERTFEYDAGIDLDLFESRISTSFDYYNSTTDKLLLQQQVMAITGYSDQWNNLGKVQNQGFELDLTVTNIKTKDFDWRTTITFSHNENTLKDLGEQEKMINLGERSEAYISVVGQPSIQFFGYKTDGVWLSSEMVSAEPHGSDDVPGGLRRLDTNDDGKVDANDRVVIGNPFPDFTWGMTNELRWKQFDMSFTFQGVQGVELLNGDLHYVELRKYDREIAKNRWVSAEFPGDGRTPFEQLGINWVLTDYAVEDGSYIALRNIIVGYTLSQESAKRVFLNGLRIYVSAENLITFMSKDYRGRNPDARYTSANYTNPLIDGYQRGAFPIITTITGGIKITF